MAVIGDMEYLEIGDKSYRIADNQALYSVPVADASTVGGVKAGGTGISIAADGTISATATGGGTVTSVRVQATSPVQSSQSTAQTTTLNTTISLADGYGDTKNPYGTKTANTVLAGPSTGSASAPTFRSLVADDIPDLSGSYATATHTHGNITNDGKLQTTDVTIATGDKLVVTDSSNSNKIARTSISFDTGTGNTAKYLSKAGTWVDIPQGTAYSAGSGLSLSGTEFNHSNSVTAQTTQALYPISIDSEGHISGYGDPLGDSVIYVANSTTGGGSVTAGTKATFSQGTDSFTSASFQSGFYTAGTAASFTRGVDSFTANTPTVINTSKFNAGSFTSGTFSQGTLPSLTFAIDGTDSNQLDISWSTGTLPSHGSDSFTAPSLGSGFYTAGTAASFTQGVDSFTANTPTVINTTKFSGGSFTQGSDSFTQNTPTAVTLPIFHEVTVATDSRVQ